MLEGASSASDDDLKVDIEAAGRLEQQAGDLVRALLDDPKSKAETAFLTRWTQAVRQIAAIGDGLRIEEDRRLARLALSAVRTVSPIAAAAATSPAQTLALPDDGSVLAPGMLEGLLHSVEDEISQCVAEEQRLAAEIEALAEVAQLDLA